jgi:hypothetical protein
MVVAPEDLTGTPKPPIAEWALPNRWSAAVFGAKVFVYRLRRRIADLASGPRRLDKADKSEFSTIAAESVTPLWSDERPEEHRYQLGKVQNLRRAVAALDGVLVPAGEVFSFWRQVGRASQNRGYVAGRMLQQGCLVPAVGGGLCQLSNALYDTALQAGCEIVERHAHSRVVAGSAAASGRDATVAWNYVDLRFRALWSLRIEARLTRDELVIRLHGQAGPTATAPVAAPDTALQPRGLARSCATCGETACFHHEHGLTAPLAIGCTAFLVDENWPEFQDYIGMSRRSGDTLGLPIDGRRWHLPRYRWTTEEFARVETASLQTLARTLAIRRAPPQGAARRKAELRGAERIAARLSRLLTPDVTKVCIAQSLLPFLWREGHLSGREVEVLMTRLPMAEIHARLGRAFAAHPERATLGDFRAPQTLVAAEAEALAYATAILTPHAEIARLFSDKIVLLDWRLPASHPVTHTSSCRIAFSGPTIARKGAYEVREAARALGLEIVTLGSELEGPDFWNGVTLTKADPSGNWLDGIGAVVQPAIVEERPRHLLTALAAGVPVIATAACGLPVQDGVAIVPEDDPAALIEALQLVLG